MLIRQEVVNEVTIHLPAGLSATFELHGQRFDADAAACFVVKDAGDDPDVTNGAEVHARTTLVPFDSLPFGSARRTECGLSGVEARAGIIISGGIGIGRATKPGLAVAPGEWAINPVPRRMIEEAVRVVSPHNGMRVEISIPDGAERAKKTLNARLGIVGGLSILGTSGIVRPLSAAAWTDTIDTALDVARACGCATVVLSTGRTSEMAAQNWLKSSPPQSPLIRGEAKAPPLTRGGGGGVTLPEEAYIMMGDHVAHSLRAT
jgi:cobalt-precorrin-5B (C1)-methyltransferase